MKFSVVQWNIFTKSVTHIICRRLTGMKLMDFKQHLRYFMHGYMILCIEGYRQIISDIDLYCPCLYVSCMTSIYTLNLKFTISESAFRLE